MSKEITSWIWTSTDNCAHENFTYRKVYFMFLFFHLTKTVKVCHNCYKLIEEN